MNVRIYMKIRQNYEKIYMYNARKTSRDNKRLWKIYSLGKIDVRIHAKIRNNYETEIAQIKIKEDSDQRTGYGSYQSINSFKHKQYTKHTQERGEIYWQHIFPAIHFPRTLSLLGLLVLTISFQLVRKKEKEMLFFFFSHQNTHI